MDTQTETGTFSSNPRFFIIAAILVVLAAIILIFALINPASSSNGLLPALATPTPLQNESESLSPIPVTFSELNADPLAYLNLPIQVSGSYLKLDTPPCPRFSGPRIEWALVAEDLQLEAKGFERVLRILAPGTEMTVQGIWRLYQGPLGCGKGPAPGDAWYLQVQRIVQPNPLVSDGSDGLVGIESANPGLPDLLPTGIPTQTPLATTTVMATTPEATGTFGQVAPTITIDATGTVDVGIATPSATPALITNTPSPGGGTLVPSATPTATPTSGSGGSGPNTTATPQTPLPPTATQSSGGGGYEGPPTSTPTASPDPYA